MMPKAVFPSYFVCVTRQASKTSKQNKQNCNATVPRGRSGARAYLTVPTGCACIVQRDGKNLGEWEPGRHRADWHYRIAYVVTKQAVTYNYSVSGCATRDNVMARVDLTFVFYVERPVTFVYKLGATHFNEMLKSVSEEATRALIRSIDHTSIYELRSSAADQLLSVLNRTVCTTHTHRTVHNREMTSTPKQNSSRSLASTL